MKFDRRLALGLGCLLLLGALIPGCGGTNTINNQVFQQNFVTHEFLLTTNNAALGGAAVGGGVTAAPLANFVTGTLNAAGEVTTQVANAQSSASVAINGNIFEWVADGTNTISAFVINPVTGAGTANGTFTSNVTVNAATGTFGKFSLAVDPTHGFLLVLNQNGANSDIQAFPINANGTLGTATEIVNNAGVGGNVPTAITTTTVGGTNLIGVTLSGVVNNVQVAPLVIAAGAITVDSANGAQTVAQGTGTTAATAVAFSFSGGKAFVNAVTDGTTAIVAAFPITVTAGVVTLGTIQTANLINPGTAILADNAGHVFTSNSGTTTNVQTFNEAAADGTLTPPAQGGTGSTASAAAAGSLALDPSGFGLFIYVSNQSGAAGNITLFPLTGAISLGTGVAQSAGTTITELHTLVTVANQ